MSTPITSSITEGQRKQYLRFVEDAAERALKEADLDKDGLQRVIENGDDLQAAIVAKLKELSVTDEYADEEVASRYGYLSGYRPKGIAEQIKILRKLFPDLGSADEKLAEQPLPPGAEGWFAIPRWGKIASTYNEAVEKVLAALNTQRKGKFYNWREGELGPQYLRQHQRTMRMLQQLGEEQQGHDILIVPAQFGLRHRGRSVRRARAVFTATEFGLGAFAVGIMLLTHPERLQHYDDLWIDCPGDEYSPAADGEFVCALRFSFEGGRLRFGGDWVGRAYGGFGSASGFLRE